MTARLVIGAIVCAAGMLATGAACAAPVAARDLDAGWTFRLDPADPAAKAHPDTLAWRPAHVPGVAQTDLLAAGAIPDPFVGDAEAALQWIGLADWDYRRTLDIDAVDLARKHLDLVFNGLDTFAEVRVNGRLLIEADNQFRRWRADAKPLLHTGANTVEVVFRSPIRKLQPQVLAAPYVLPGAYDSPFGDEPAGKQTSTYIRKSPYHYGWDWGPRYVTEGLWLPVRLEAWDDARLDGAEVQTRAIASAQARLTAVADVVADGAGSATVTVRPTDPDGRALTPVTARFALTPGANRLELPVSVDTPKLWWPTGYGAQPLYDFAIEVSVEGAPVASTSRRIGLRTVELRRQADAFGKSFEFVVNGTPIFAKGANLIPSDSFLPRVTPAVLDRTLVDAKAANMNMLRVWGGGSYLPDAFYARADQLGLMIWQEFMFGGAVPPYDTAFRDNAATEAAEQVRWLGDHPSIVLWCGNNEVETGWEHWGDRIAFKGSIAPDERDRVMRGMTVLFGQVLRDAVARDAPGTPYWASSPSTDFDQAADLTTDGDQHFWTVWGGAPVSDYLTDTPRFMSEYGLQAMPDIATVRAWAGPGPLSVDAPVVRAHQKYDKGNGGQRLLTYIRREYGEPKDFDSFVYLSQVMQAEGIELAALHHRASRPQTMGSLYWQLNDVWPGASWASVDWYGRWKALHYHARRFFAPLVVAAPHADGAVQVTGVSDRTTPSHLAWRLQVMDVDGQVLATRAGQADVPALSATRLARFTDAELLGGADPTRTFAVVELAEGGHILSRAFVYFVPAKAMKLDDPGLDAHLVPGPGGLKVTVHATRLARAVWIDLGGDARLSDNAFDLLPGETRTLDVEAPQDAGAARLKVSVRSLWGATSGAGP